MFLEARLRKMRDRDWVKILLVAFGGPKIIGRLRHDIRGVQSRENH